eukprot:TRINITY_DN1660_c0_g1_i2.p1 TRINITY_DN1660_c0_g1~~TRINITY_DN1660_c0_g1_i2.p1  ORF type:complete len:472 (+),score=139.16 TRINITY_DN1660_c0_g1_i2:231-1646(+)
MDGDDGWEQRGRTMGSGGGVVAGGRNSAGEEEEDWNKSSFKRFDWDEGLEEATFNSFDKDRSVLGTTSDDVVFEDTLATSGSTRALEARVKEVAKQIAAEGKEQEQASLSTQVESRDPMKLEAELKTVRRKLESFHVTKYQPDPAVTTVQNIMLGKPFCLERYKSLKKKEDLLDCALEMGDGDAILAITLMIRRSLNHPKFLSVISSRPLAANHLINYMITRHEMNQVIDLLHALGRFHYAGVVAYRQATARGGIDDRIRKLKKLYHAQMSGHEDSNLVLEQINLLERVSPLLAAESQFADRQVSNLSSSVLQALGYLSTWYYGTPENNLYSPSALIKMHKLTRTQANWGMVRARASVLAWKDCESLLVGKGWMGGVKAKGEVDIMEMATVLHDAKCPPETLSLILQAVESPSDRLDLAKKLGVAKVVVDVMVAQKDRVALLGYRDSLTRSSEGWVYADHVINKANVKWKN